MSVTECVAGIEMCYVIQRAHNAEVVIDEKSQGKLEKGLVVFAGFGVKDAGTNALAEAFAENDFQKVREGLQSSMQRCVEKICGLRIFEDDQGKMNLSVKDIAGGIYLISQFTLFADCSKGFRPGFSKALKPQPANFLFEELKTLFAKTGVVLHTGLFGADMRVSLTSVGPVTILFKANKDGFL